MQVIETSEALFVVGDDIKLTGQNRFVYNLDPKVFQKVSQFIETFKDDLAPLMVSDGHKMEYWERNYHDEIVHFLAKLMPTTTSKEISNCLNALGY